MQSLARRVRPFSLGVRPAHLGSCTRCDMHMHFAERASAPSTLWRTHSAERGSAALEQVGLVGEQYHRNRLAVRLGHLSQRMRCLAAHLDLRCSMQLEVLQRSTRVALQHRWPRPGYATPSPDASGASCTVACPDFMVLPHGLR